MTRENVSSASTEDAKRLAIKEEQYDPGYEDAYGGTYTDRGAGGGPDQNQTNGHCAFSSGNVPSHSVRLCVCLCACACVFSLSLCPSEGAQEASSSQPADGQLPDGRWMTQSFADQIPDIGGGQTEDSG